MAKKPEPKKAPEIDLSKITAVGSFCDLTAIKFIRDRAKCSKQEAETSFQFALKNGLIVPVGAIGLMGTVMAYRSA